VLINVVEFDGLWMVSGCGRRDDDDDDDDDVYVCVWRW
jgi:hypothetical protein